MAKRRVEQGLLHLKADVEKLKREKAELYEENNGLRHNNMMLKDALGAIVEDETLWSQEALQSGLVWRLKNVLQQIAN